jgi:hypothetical protein
MGFFEIDGGSGAIGAVYWTKTGSDLEPTTPGDGIKLGDAIIEHNIAINKTTGWLWGGEITINAVDDTKIDISEGAVEIVTGMHSSIAKIISWDAQIALDPVLTTRTKWVAIKDNGSGGAAFIFDTGFDSIERRTHAIIGKIRSNTVDGHLTNIDDFERPAWGLLTAFQDFILEFGSINLEGHEVSANPSMQINIAAGRSYRYHAEDVIGKENVHIDPAFTPRITYAYILDGSGIPTSRSTLDPDYYSLAGVKTALANNKYSRQELRIFPVSGSVYVIYGKEEFDDITDAVEAGSPVITNQLTKDLLDGSFPAGSIIMEKGVSDLAAAISAGTAEILPPGNGGTGGGVGTDELLIKQTGGGITIHETGLQASVFSSDSDSYLLIRSGYDGLGTEKSSLIFVDNTLHKWRIEKDDSNNFNIYDNTRAANVLSVEENGNMLLMGSGGNVGIGATNIESWASGLNIVQIGKSGSVASNKTINSLMFMANAMYDGNWRYMQNDGASRIKLGDGHMIFQTAVDGIDGDVIDWKEALRIDNAGNVFINETSNTKMTQGLTINQGVNDNEILALKSSDVSHSMTTLTEADTYFCLRKLDAASGGANIRGLSDADHPGLVFQGVMGTDNPTDTTPAIKFQGMKYNGATGAGALADDETVLAVQNGGNGVLTVKGNGDTLVGGKINVGSISEYADNAAAIAGGLSAGDFYRTGDLLKVVH